MKIYTGTGDGGKTSLFSGERLRKNDFQVAAYGAIDEVSSFIGVLESTLPEYAGQASLSANLHTIQADLFVVGALLATSPSSPDTGLLRPLERERIDWLEQQIDVLQMEVEELHFFILPGGHPAAAWSHVTRTVCRRAEREVITWVERNDRLEFKNIIGYLNRLSDYFFILARFLNKVAGRAEITWHE